MKFVLIQFFFGDSRSLFQAITPLWSKYMPIFWHFSGWWWGHLPLAGKKMLQVSEGYSELCLKLMDGKDSHIGV